MEEKYQTESYRLFYVWLIVSAVAVFGYVVLADRYVFTNSAVYTGYLCHLLLCILFLLVLVKDAVYWIPGITYECARSAGRAKRKKWAWTYLCSFVAAALLYVCYREGWFLIPNGDAITDSMTAAVLIVLARYCAGWMCSYEIVNQEDKKENKK